jgi:hypothetical protein
MILPNRGSKCFMLLELLVVIVILSGFIPCCVFAQSVDFDGKSYPRRGWDDPREAEYITTVTREVKTPHLPTAIPYSQGPTRVLFICPRYSARPTVELCQRFDIQERHALVSKRRELTGLSRAYMYGLPGDTAEEVQQALRHGLSSKPEVVVLYDFAWSLLPAEVRQQIAGLVQSGVGLVFWNLEEGNALPKELAPFAPDAKAAAGILGCVPAEVRYRFEGLKAFSSPGGGRVAAFTAQPVRTGSLLTGRVAATGQIWDAWSGSSDLVIAEGGVKFPANPTRVATGSGGGANIVKFGKAISSGVLTLEFDFENPTQDNVIELHLLDSISGKDLYFSLGYDAAGYLVGHGFDGSFWNSVAPKTDSLHVKAVFNLDAKSTSLSWFDNVDPSNPLKCGSASKTYTGTFNPDSLGLLRNAAHANSPSGFDNIVVGISKSSAATTAPATAEEIFSDNFENVGSLKGLFSYLDDEDLYAVVGRSMHWTAKREPRARLDAKIDTGVLRVDLQGEKLPDAKVDLAIYDLAAVLRHELEHQAKVRPGEAWKLPHLKAGPHWVRLTLRSGTKVVDWTTRYVHVTAPVAVEAITFEQEHIPQGGTVKAKVRLSGQTLEKYVLEYRLVDTYDRVIRRGQMTPKPQVTISAAVQDCLTPMCFLVVSLQQEGRTVAESRAWFTVAQPPVDAEDFHASVWPYIATADGPIWQNWLTVMQKQIGMGFVLGKGYQAFSAEVKPSADKWPVYLLNVRPYVYAINHGPHGVTEDRGGPTRKPCLTSEEYNRESDRTLTERARDSFRFSPICYTDCGDALLHRDGNDVCFSDTCIRDFQEYLKTRYTSLEELNKNWQADYKEWSEITPVTLAELEAWKTDPVKPKPSPGQYARWVEHRMHMESVFTDRHRRDLRVIRAVDPQARTGVDAIMGNCSSFAGIDFIKLFDFMGAFGPYQNPFKLQVARSLASPGTLLGCWVGGGYPQYRTQQYATAAAWMLLFNRFNMQLFFLNYTGSGDACPMFAPDLRPFPVMAEQIKQMREVQTGTGKLLLSARRENDGIAFFYSPASLHAATLTRGMPAAEFKSTPKYNSGWLEYETANEAMALFFTDLGLQYDYVTPKQVADGRLSREGFRVLVLSYAQAFSAEVAEAIRRFAASGGVVIADLRPGLFDEHGRLLERGQLDDLFGIERARGFPEPLKMLPLSPVTGPGQLPEMPVDHQVKVTSASALVRAGSAPAFVSHKFDGGRAILLNFYPGRYIALRVKGVEKPMLQSIKDLLASAGVQPRVRATTGEAAVPATEIVRFTHGANEYVGILREHVLRWAWPIPITNGEPCLATVDFGRKAHVYDVRAGRYLGDRQQVETTIVPAQAKLYALLPYQVKAVQATEVPSGTGPEKHFSLKVVTTNNATSGTHVLHVEVEDSKGRNRPEYAQNLKVEQGAGTFRLPLALSDPGGNWKLSVRDSATGVMGETRFAYRP